MDGVKSKISVGDIVYVKEGIKHGIKAITELEIIEV